MQLVGGAPTDVSVINARKYHLTYAALGRGELSNEDVLSQLTAKRAHQMPLQQWHPPAVHATHLHHQQPADRGGPHPSPKAQRQAAAVDRRYRKIGPLTLMKTKKIAWTSVLPWRRTTESRDSFASGAHIIQC